MFGSQTSADKPIQLYHFGNPKVQCHLLEPDDELKQDIHYYWHIKIAQGPVDLTVIPDNAIDFIMSPDVADFAAVYFPAAEMFTIALEGPVSYAGVCFQFGKIERFFDISTNEMRCLAEGASTLQHLRLDKIVNQLQGEKSLARIKSAFNTEFLNRKNHKRKSPEKMATVDVPRLIAAMQQTVGDAGMSDLAARFELSDRQFRRILTNMFGFGPKKIQRIVRLQLAIRELMHAEREGVLDGFYDDAHRIRELRTLTGMTPGDIRRLAEIYNQSK